MFRLVKTPRKFIIAIINLRGVSTNPNKCTQLCLSTTIKIGMHIPVDVGIMKFLKSGKISIKIISYFHIAVAIVKEVFDPRWNFVMMS